MKVDGGGENQERREEEREEEKIKLKQSQKPVNTQGP